MSRLFFAAGTLVLSGLPALAGGYGCEGAACYTPSYVPPTYGLVTEKVAMSAPQTHAMVTPGEYRTVYDTVQVGGGRVWSVTRDPVTGRLVGCWITKPATYATVPRTVMVRAPQVIPYAVPAVYGYRTSSVMTSPGYKAWVPAAPPAYGGGYADGGGYGGGYGYGGGFAVRAGYGGRYGYGYGRRHYYPRQVGYGPERRGHVHHGGRHHASSVRPR